MSKIPTVIKAFQNESKSVIETIFKFHSIQFNASDSHNKLLKQFMNISLDDDSNVTKKQLSTRCKELSIMSSGTIDTLILNLKENKKIKEKNNDNNKIWSHILDSINFDDNQINTTITTKQIKESNEYWTGHNNQFEPRLLCKQDTLESRPLIFKEKNLNIFSINNYSYVITQYNIYIELINDNTNIIEIEELSLIKEHPLLKNNGENDILTKLKYNKVFERPEFLGEPIILSELLNGRRRCNFKTYLNNEEFNITGSQFETDGYYESENNIIIVEVKSKQVNNFNIRQLYYPYRYVFDKFNKKKQIICLFICKDVNNIVHIYKYKWNNPEHMIDLEQTDYYQINYK